MRKSSKIRLFLRITGLLYGKIGRNPSPNVDCSKMCSHQSILGAAQFPLKSPNFQKSSGPGMLQNGGAKTKRCLAGLSLVSWRPPVPHCHPPGTSAVAKQGHLTTVNGAASYGYTVWIYSPGSRGSIQSTWDP